MKSKTYYQRLDILRIIACIMVLLYHLNLLKGGFLAVCIFLVLSSYLACFSVFKKEKFSILEYYKNRFIKLYLPLLIVVFVTISLISFIPEINFFNLKPETTSILLGYNNFWQLQANLDYFARHISSPFMHFWYIAILMQFDLVFPFIYKFLKLLGDKVHKSLAIIVPLIGGIVSYIFFCLNVKNNIMVAYYHTGTRCFALLFGLALAFYHFYYRPNLKKQSFIWEAISLGLILILNILIDANSFLMPIAMLIVTFVTLFLINQIILTKEEKKSKTKESQLIKKVASFSYEIYLWQYPLIFLVPYLVTNKFVNCLIIVILSFALAFILHYSLDYKNPRFKIGRYLSFTIFIGFTIFGFIKFLGAVDHTLEMENLEALLNQNEALLREKQEEYIKAKQEEEQVWLSTLEKFDATNGDIESLITNMPIIGIGDSVMLGAVTNLYDKFPNGYFDAKISRTAWAVNDILVDLKDRKLLGNPIIFHLGTNGDCSEACKVKIMESCAGKDVFWLTTTYEKQASFNTKIINFKEKYHYDNLHIIDWATISKGHTEYFASDGIHLTLQGRKAYTETLYDEIYNFYYQKYQEQKDTLIKDHEAQLKDNFSFYGNDLILNLYPYIQDDFNTSLFPINKDYDYETLSKELSKAIKDESLTNKVVIAMDNLNEEEYQKLITLLKDYQVYLILLKPLELLTDQQVKIIDFSKELKDNPNYLRLDGQHLTPEGNEALRNKLVNELLNN